MAGPKFKPNQGRWFVPEIAPPPEHQKRAGHKGGIARQLMGDINHEALRLRRFSWQGGE